MFWWVYEESPVSFWELIPKAFTKGRHISFSHKDKRTSASSIKISDCLRWNCGPDSMADSLGKEPSSNSPAYFSRTWSAMNYYSSLQLVVSLCLLWRCFVTNIYLGVFRISTWAPGSTDRKSTREDRPRSGIYRDYVLEGRKFKFLVLLIKSSHTQINSLAYSLVLFFQWHIYSMVSD